MFYYNRDASRERRDGEEWHKKYTDFVKEKRSSEQSTPQKGKQGKNEESKNQPQNARQENGQKQDDANNEKQKEENNNIPQNARNIVHRGNLDWWGNMDLKKILFLISNHRKTIP